MNSVILFVMLVVFVATVVRSTFGFGEALVAVPLLALRIPVAIAAPLAVLLSITVAGIIVAQDWRKIHVGSASWLVLSTLAGIPIGLWLLTAVNERHTKITLGVFILLYSIYSLTARKRIHLKSDSRAWMLACGFFAGILGGAYGLNGPPLVIYGSMRQWSAQHFRATLQGYFLPASAITMAAYLVAGLWNWPVTRYYLWSLPPAIIAIFIGRALNHRLPEDSFLKYVYVGLAGIGVLLLGQAMHG